MTTFLDKLRSARTSAASVHYFFLLEYAREPRMLHSFFEGDNDSSIYLSPIYAIMPDECKLRVYKCGDKDGIYDVYNKINWETHDRKRAIFFVDRDFDDIIPENRPQAPNIFVTRYYSVESYLVTPEMLERVLLDIFHLSHADPRVEPILQQFQKQLVRFYRFIFEVMAWVLDQRRAGRKPMLKNLNLQALLEITDDLTIKVRGNRAEPLHTYLGRICSIPTNLSSWSDRKTTRDMLKHVSPKLATKGKFEIWFFVNFVQRIAPLLNQMRPPGTPRISLKTQLHENNPTEILGPRLITPPELTQFLESTIGQLGGTGTGTQLVPNDT